MTQLHRAGQVALAPDGTWLAVAVARLDRDDKKYVSDLWRVPLGAGAEPPRRLTWGEWNDTAPGFRRDGSLAFLSNRPRPDRAPEGGDVPGGPPAQVWILPASGGEPLPLTDEPLGVRDFRFAAAADRLVALADALPGVRHEEQRARARELAERGPSGLRYTTTPIRFWDHWLEPAAPHAIAYDEQGGGRVDLTPDADRDYRPDSLQYAWDLSRDGRTLVLPAQRLGKDRVLDVALDVIDTATGQRAALGAEDGVTHTSPRISPDGRHIACTRHQREPGVCGPIRAWLYPTAGGAGRALAPSWDTWPTIEAWSPDGRSVLCTADQGGTTPVFAVEVATGEVSRITAEAAGGCHGSLVVDASPIGTPRVFGVRHTLLHPPEPFRVALAPDQTPELVASLSGLSPGEGAALARWRSFEVPGDGGTQVQSFLVTPAKTDAPPPVLLWIHGGPMNQHHDGWHWRWNPLLAVDQGYAVVLPNPRGSTGRGQAFIEGVWNNQWGAACYRDLMAVVSEVERMPEVDGSRIAAMGGSFGGYMANWIGGQTDRFRCLVTHASIYHLPAFHGTTDDPPVFALEMGGTPYNDPAAFDRYSPHRFVDRWKSPTLIIHGEKDYRVPVSEALLLFEALKMHGVEAELLLYPDENHWIRRPRNTRQWYQEIFTFLARHMA